MIIPDKVLKLRLFGGVLAFALQLAFGDGDTTGAGAEHVRVAPAGAGAAAMRSPNTRENNMHLLPGGKWELGGDGWGKIVRVNMLKIEDADWEKVPGVKKAWRMKGFEGVEGMAFHPIVSEVKDVDGDGKPDVFRLRSERAGARIERLRYDDGSVVWESDPVGGLYGDESRLAVYELKGSNDWCVFYADKAGVYCFDAATGMNRWRQDGGGGDFTVGHSLQRDKAAMVIHANGVLRCLDEAGRTAWSHDTGLRDDNAYAHEIFRGDADGDGLDEIVVNMQKRTLALRGDGSILWEDRTQAHHSDFLDMADVDGDGRMELIYDHEGCSAEKGPVYVVDALTGQRKATIDYRAQGLRHAQNAAIGTFDPSRKGKQLALCGKLREITLWDMASGELLWKRDAPSSLLSKGDWNGDGADELMVFSLGANVDGMFSVWNGKGERLYAISFLPSPYNYFQPPPGTGDASYKQNSGGSWRATAMPGGHEGIRRQVNFDGNGRVDVIMPFGEWHWGSDSILFLMEAESRAERPSEHSTASPLQQGAPADRSRGAPSEEDWGPFVGPWKGHTSNPLLTVRDFATTYSVQNGPQTVFKHRGKWFMTVQIGVGPVAAMVFSRLFCGLFRLCGWLRRHHGIRIAFGRRRGSGCFLQQRRIFQTGDHCRNLLTLRTKEQLSQPSDRSVLVLQQFQQMDVGLAQRSERRAVILGQLVRLDAPQDVFQLAHVHLDDRRFRWHDDTSNHRR